MAAKNTPLPLEFPVATPTAPTTPAAEAKAAALPDPVPMPTPEAAAPAKVPEAGPVDAGAEAARLAFPEPAAAAPIRPAMLRGPSPRHLIAKLAEVMGEIGWITKRGRNTYFNYDYATESDILDAIRSELSKRKIFVQTIVEEEFEKDSGKKNNSGKPLLYFKVRTLHIFHDAESGETMDVIGIGYASDDGDKGFYKAYTGAVKYAFSKTFLISTGDDPEKTPDKEEKKGAGKTMPAAKGPQRNGDQGPEHDEFEVIAEVGEWREQKTSNNRMSWKFSLPGGIASTLDEKIAMGLTKEAGTGMRFRFILKRTGSFTDIIRVSMVEPGA